MLFVKKSKTNTNDMYIDALVKGYFDYVKKNTPSNLSGSEVSELLRCSICRLFELETKGYTKRIEDLSEGVVASLDKVARRYNLFAKSKDYKMGLLEACVHCMEMSRKEVGI